MINWNDLFAAFALYLIFEGLIPFFNPDAFRKIMQRISALTNSSIRVFGLASMLLGLGLLYLVRS